MLHCGKTLPEWHAAQQLPFAGGLPPSKGLAPIAFLGFNLNNMG
jgi:hypothetical protein